MDRFDAMRVFTRVMERRSFTLAAEDLGIPRSTVTDAIKQLEKRLGAQMFLRTTRHVNPTLDGQAYYQRCIEIIANVEDAEGGFSGQPQRLAARRSAGDACASFSPAGVTSLSGEISGD